MILKEYRICMPMTVEEVGDKSLACECQNVIVIPQTLKRIVNDRVTDQQTFDKQY